MGRKKTDATLARRFMFATLTQKLGRRISFGGTGYPHVLEAIREVDSAFVEGCLATTPKGICRAYAKSLWKQHSKVVRKERREVDKAEFRRKRAEVVPGRCVYIIGNVHAGYCKIGFTTALDKRLPAIQTGCPFPLSVLAVFDGRGMEYERALHKRAEKQRTYGEWFRIEGALRDYLASIDVL